MSVLTVRGGAPYVLLETIGSAAAVEYPFPFPTLHLNVHCSTNPLKVYFTAADAAADANYVTVLTGAVGWQGPAEVDRVWLRGSGGNSVAEVVAFQRRG